MPNGKVNIFSELRALAGVQAGDQGPDRDKSVLDALRSGDPHSVVESAVTVPGLSRSRRLLEGWSANFVQMLLGITQQVALIPVFLHFWTSDVLASAAIGMILAAIAIRIVMTAEVSFRE